MATPWLARRVTEGDPPRPVILPAPPLNSRQRLLLEFPSRKGGARIPFGRQSWHPLPAQLFQERSPLQEGLLRLAVFFDSVRADGALQPVPVGEGRTLTQREVDTSATAATE